MSLDAQTPVGDPLPEGPPKDAPIEFSEAQLLAEPEFDEPLIAGGVRCHGGFIDGEYVSPRTLVRMPAIDAWQSRLRLEGPGVVDISREFMPPHYPSLEQAKLLLRAGVQKPITRSLTMISIVEGFGAMIRDVPVPDLRAAIKEDLAGTALSHLTAGLFEAHARDEAGHRDQGGHKQMWEAARDLAFENPRVPGDVLARLMQGRGRNRRPPLFPTLPEKVEGLIATMANVMVIEIFADDVFSWGEALLGDPEVSAAAEAASRMVSYIRADERPHVEYLRTALSEVRCRTLLTIDGGEIPGREVVDAILAQQLRGIASSRPREQREALHEEIRADIAEMRLSSELMRKFTALDDGWTFPRSEDDPIEIALS